MTTEASDAAWQRPSDALADWKGGRRALMPPTWVTLAELDELGSVSVVVDAPRTVSKVIPKLVREGSVFRVVVS
jgi:hypothetical protein